MHRIRVLIWTVEENLGYFGLKCRPERGINQEAPVVSEMETVKFLVFNHFVPLDP